MEWRITTECNKRWNYVSEGTGCLIALFLVSMLIGAGISIYESEFLRGGLFFSAFATMWIVPPAVDIGIHLAGVGRDVWSRLKNIPVARAARAKNARRLDRLAPERIEPYIGAQLPTVSDLKAVEEMCREIVRDQLERPLLPTEDVFVLDVCPVEGRDAAFVTFVYRHCEQAKQGGVSRDQVNASAHTVRLSVNEIARCVDVAVVSSLGHKELSGVDDPVAFIRGVNERVTPGFLTGVGSPNNLALPSRSTTAHTATRLSE